MTKEVTIAAGEVLTKALFNKVNKAAYQFGGFKTVGGVQKKSFLNQSVKTKILIPKKYIKGDIAKFVNDFEKTMNSFYYQLIIE